MDEMKIESKFTTGIVSKIAKMIVRNNFGSDMDIRLNGLRTTVIEGTTHIHLDLDIEIDKHEPQFNPQGWACFEESVPSYSDMRQRGRRHCNNCFGC